MDERKRLDVRLPHRGDAEDFLLEDFSVDTEDKLPGVEELTGARD